MLPENFIIQGSNGPFVNLEVLVFFDRIEKSLSADQKKVVEFIRKNHKTDVLKLLNGAQTNSLKEIVLKFFTKGYCHFCKEEFGWEDQPVYSHVMDGPRGPRPHHKRCYPQKRTPSPALQL